MGPSRFLASPRVLYCALLLSASGFQPAAAQADPSTDPRFAEAAERARIEADKVFKRILINGQLPKRATPAASEPAPAAPARPAPAQRPAPPAPKRAEPATPPRPATANAEGQPRNTGPSGASVAPVAKASATPLPAAASAPPTAAAASAAAPTLPVPPPRALAAEAHSDTSHTRTAAAPEAAEPEEDQPLILLHQVDPDFPAAIVRRQKKGAVMVRFEVQVDGSVKQAEVTKSSNPRLNAAALAAVAQWRFEPLSRPQTASAELAFDLHQSFDQ